MGLVCAGLTMLTSAHAHGPLHGEINALDEQLARQPNNAALLLRRAELLQLDGNLTNALADLQAAERLAPALEGVWWVRGRLLLEQQKPAAALPDLDRWLERHPRHEGALTARAKARELTRDFAGAVADHTRAIAAADRPGPDSFLARAQAQRKLGPEHRAAALRGLDEGIVRLGDLVVLQLEAIDLEQALGRPDAALERMDKLIGQAARKESWLARRAELLERAGRPAEARQAWGRALEECLTLPARLRLTRAAQELEQRIRRNLPPTAVAEAERHVASSPASRPLPPSTTAQTRTVPNP